MLPCLRKKKIKRRARFCSTSLGGGRGLLPIMAYTGRLRPGGDTFFRLQVYERAGISLVEVYKRVGKSVILVREGAQRANT